MSRQNLIGQALGLSLALFALLLMPWRPAMAEANEVRISRGYGLLYLPLIVMEDQKLLEKEAAKAGLGESDLQPRYLGLRDYTFLRDAAKTSGIKVLLWEKGSGSEVAFYPNLNANDETWKKLNRDVRFRRALSLAIDRGELSEVVYNGMAKPSANTIMPRSPLFRPELATKWATHDAKMAEKLLDEWRFDEARPVVADMVRAAPEAPQTLYVQGYLRFLEGDYEGAVRNLNTAAEAAPPAQSPPLQIE